MSQYPNSGGGSELEGLRRAIRAHGKEVVPQPLAIDQRQLGREPLRFRIHVSEVMTLLSILLIAFCLIWLSNAWDNGPGDY